MIKIACRHEISSPIFTDFCKRNSCISTVDDNNIYWETPWLFYNSNIFCSRDILCTGLNSKAFATYLRNEGKTEGIQLCCDVYSLNCNNKFDLIIGIRMDSLYKNFNKIRLFKHVYSLVKLGKNFIFTVPVNIRNGVVDLIFMEEILNETGFKLLKPEPRLSLQNYQFVIDDLGGTGANKDIFVQNAETLAGIVLYKPYNLDSMGGKRYQIKRSWLHTYENNEAVIMDFVGFSNEIDKIGLFNDILYRKLWFPDKLLDEIGFAIEDLCVLFNMDKLDAVDLINEMLCMGCLIEIQ